MGASVKGKSGRHTTVTGTSSSSAEGRLRTLSASTGRPLISAMDVFSYVLFEWSSGMADSWKAPNRLSTFEIPGNLKRLGSI